MKGFILPLQPFNCSLSSKSRPLPKDLNKICILSLYLDKIRMKDPSGAMLSLATEQYIRKPSAPASCLSFSHFHIFSLTGFLWPPNLHFSGSSWRKTNKEPSKALPRASIQMWSTVWQMKHWSIPTPFPFSIVGKYCLACLADSLSELHVFRSITASQSTAPA